MRQTHQDRRAGDPVGATQARIMDHTPGDVGEAFRQLSGLLLEEETRTSALDQVVHLAVATIPRCDECGISVRARSGVFTTAGTGDVEALDAHQYAANEGPCLDALDHGQPYRLTLRDNGARWPNFVSAMVDSGMEAMLAMPLTVRDRTLGALNIYSRTPAPFSAEDFSIAELYAGQAGVALANLETHEVAVELAAQLRRALDSRAIIEQAKGILMASRGLNAEQAFETLIAASQHENRKLRDIATTVVETVVGGW
jgi:GAF domain-containing protein